MAAGCHSPVTGYGLDGTPWWEPEDRHPLKHFFEELCRNYMALFVVFVNRQIRTNVLLFVYLLGQNVYC